MASLTSDRRLVRRDWLTMLALTLLGAFFRTREILDPLWLDELHTAWCVSDGLGSIADRAAEGNHSPLYFYFAWLSTSLFGQSEWALRLPSIVFGSLLAPTVYACVRIVIDCRTSALVAAAFAMFDYYPLMYSQEARPYSLVMWLAAINWTSFYASIRRDAAQEGCWKSRALFVATWCVLFYTHYTTLLMLVPQVGLALVLHAKGYRRWGLDVLLVALCCLPAWAHLTRIAGRRDNWTFVTAEPAYTMITTFRLDMYVVVPWAICSVAFVGYLLLARQQSERLVERPVGGVGRPIALFAAWALVPVVIAWTATATDVARLMFHRYIIASAVGTFCLGASAFAILPAPRMRAQFAILITTAVVFGSGGPVRWYKGELCGRNEDWSTLATDVRRSDPQGKLPLVLCPGLIEDGALDQSDSAELRAYCLFPVSAFYTFPQPDEQRIVRPTAAHAVSADVLRRIRASGGCWFVVRGQAGQAVEDELKARLPADFVVVRTRYGGVLLLSVAGPPK